MISHIKYAKEHILECADDSSNIKMDLNFDKINYHSYFGWKSFPPSPENHFFPHL